MLGRVIAAVLVAIAVSATASAQDVKLPEIEFGTAIAIPAEVLHLLRRVAVERANKHGGRPSVSRVLVELVEASQAELEAEL